MWKIQNINNATHKVVLVDADGEQLQLIIPESERKSSVTKLAWLKSQCDARDIVKRKKKVFKNIVPYILGLVMCSETVALILLLLGHK